ncbi:MAG: transposase [Defluviitaleaceae bacterium]|nr:transposase [Defluviitaleaceae bacterium]
MKNELSARKHPRLKSYDYSQNGYYHVTICTQSKLPILSQVGRGLAPAAELTLTTIGKIVENQLLDLPNRFPGITIDKYVIMPTHIHVIIVIGCSAAGASPRPTLSDVVRVFKPMSTRLCNQDDNVTGRQIWQASFYDEIIRDERMYQNIWKYIDENPAKWAEDCYYAR